MGTSWKRAVPAAALALMLAGCVSAPETDVAQAVRDAVQPAVDTFFEELDKTLDAKPVELDADDWGIWAGRGEARIFEARIELVTDENYYCPRQADCFPRGAYITDVTGAESGTAPAGGAVWTGRALALNQGLEDEGGPPMQGTFRLEADLGAATVDAQLGLLGSPYYAWDDVAVKDNGRFFTTDGGGAALTGAFYGSGHEGVAGKFGFAASGIYGVFGAIRE